MQSTGKSKALGVALALIVLAGVASGFTGTPNIQNGQLFYMYSVQYASYCSAVLQVLNPGFFQATIQCNGGLVSPDYAAQFVISNGSTSGNVVANQTTNLYLYGIGYPCYLNTTTGSGTGYNLLCMETPLTLPYANQFRFSNVQPQTYLVGNSSAVVFRNSAGQGNGWCNVPSSTASNPYVQCSSSTTPSSAQYYFVPV